MSGKSIKLSDLMASFVGKQKPRRIAVNYAEAKEQSQKEKKHV